MPSSNLGKRIKAYGTSSVTLGILAAVALVFPTLAVVLDLTLKRSWAIAEASGFLIGLGALMAFAVARSRRIVLFQNGFVYFGRPIRWEDVDTVRYGSGLVGDTGPERVTIELQEGPAIVIQRPGAREIGQRIQRSIGTRVT